MVKHPIKLFMVTSVQYLYLLSLTRFLSLPNYKLFCHILISTLTQYRQLYEGHRAGWITISKRFIQDKFRNSEPETLASYNLIEIDRQYIPGRKPRFYRIAPWVLEAYVQQPFTVGKISGKPDSSLIALAAKPPLVNILTGKPLKTSKTKEGDIDKGLFNRDGLTTTLAPNLIMEAVKCFEVCYYNFEAVLKHLEALKQGYSNNPTYQNRFKYLNDWTCFDNVSKLSKPVKEQPHIHTFKPAYTLQSSGRIGTPMQSCSRVMKAAAYSGLEDVHNYDLSSSQIALAFYEMNRHGIACPWLKNYLNNPECRAEYSEFVGLSIDEWKTCLCTVLIGGYLPNHSKGTSQSSILAAIKDTLMVKDGEVIPENLEVMYQRLREALRPLLVPLKAWHTLALEQVKTTGHSTNHAGMTRRYEDFRANKTPGIIAHILQGMEAYFIHTLTLLGERYGFQPIANEHDGIITLGVIPSEALEEAKQLTGLYCLVLREKPFSQ